MISEEALVCALVCKSVSLLSSLMWSHKAGSSGVEHLRFGARGCPFPSVGTMLIP